MAITQPRVWHVCNKCNEWFQYPTNAPIKCPDCKEGELIETCAFCGEKLKECSCSSEKLNSRCHKCGFKKDDCKCID
jgi:hypothetical protein